MITSSDEGAEVWYDSKLPPFLAHVTHARTHALRYYTRRAPFAAHMMNAYGGKLKFRLGCVRACAGELKFRLWHARTRAYGCRHMKFSALQNLASAANERRTFLDPADVGPVDIYRYL